MTRSGTAFVSGYRNDATGYHVGADRGVSTGTIPIDSDGRGYLLDNLTPTGSSKACLRAC